MKRSCQQTFNSTVTVVAQQNFDAWGRKRNASNWTYTGIAAVPQWLYRGYTGHEHVEPFALINMNGRMYDPLNGRMLSADNFVNGAYSTQAYNRFSYANNNPLKYTDPDGEIPFLAVVGIVAAVSGGLNLAANWGNVNSFGDGLFYFGVGAGIGAGVSVGGAALAPVIGTGAISGAVFGAAGGFLGGFSNTMFSTGGDWNSAFNVGASGALYGGVGGALLAGAWAGFSGKDVWTGASSGGQSVFSFGGGENGPTFKLGDAYNIGRRDFWQYGRNLKPSVEIGPLELDVIQQNGSWDRYLTPNSNSHWNGRTVTNPNGVNVDINIPSDWSVRLADNGAGFVYQQPGALGNTNVIRVMGGPTLQAPRGYVVFYNSVGQPFNPLNGQTLPKNFWHFLFP